MKYCPKCNQSYVDDTLNFCLSDGAPLTDPTSISQETVIMGTADRTRPMNNAPLQRTNSSIPYILISVLALIAGGAIVALWLSDRRVASNSSQTETNNARANVASNTQQNTNTKPNTEVVKFPDSRPEPLTAEAVRDLLQVWESAQESKNFASYQSCYDPSFVGIKETRSGSSQSYTYATWMADRRRMISGSVNLSVDVSNLQVTLQGDTAVVQFDQYYRSLRYSDWGPKEMTVKMTARGPKIVKEELKASNPL